MRFAISILISLLFTAAASGQVGTSKQKNDTLPERFYLLQKVKRIGEVLPEVQIKEETVVGRPKKSEA